MRVWTVAPPSPVCFLSLPLRTTAAGEGLAGQKRSSDSSYLVNVRDTFWICVQ